MKRLVVLILSFCLSASLYSYADDASGHLSSKQVEQNKYTEDLVDYSTNNKAHAVLSHSNLRRSAASGFRIITGSKFLAVIKLVFFPTEAARRVHVISPYLYCKAIGLKLVFPQHYFW